MKKAKPITNAIIASLIVILLLILDVSYLNVTSRWLHKSSLKGSKTIVIDAGHGGIDGGTVGKSSSLEKDINLAIAKKLKSYIEENGDTCIMSREEDEDLSRSDKSQKYRKTKDLKERKALINKYNADIFISIHLNSFPGSRGAQVFYQKGDKEGKILAKHLQDELINTLDRSNKRIEKESDNYYILKNNSVPSVIVECGFLSNSTEESLLKNENYQNKVALSIFYGLQRYFDEKK